VCTMFDRVLVLVPGKKYPETGVILESEFCMVQNPCLSKSHTKFGLQDHPCFRILLAWDKYLDHLFVFFSFSFPEQPSDHRRSSPETPAINTLTNSHNGLVQGLY